MRVNRPVWPAYALTVAGIITDRWACVLLGVILFVLWLVLETFDGEVP